MFEHGKNMVKLGHMDMVDYDLSMVKPCLTMLGIWLTVKPWSNKDTMHHGQMWLTMHHGQMWLTMHHGQMWLTMHHGQMWLTMKHGHMVMVDHVLTMPGIWLTVKPWPTMVRTVSTMDMLAMVGHASWSYLVDHETWSYGHG